MITKMKKLTFLVYHKEYDAFLNNLRDLGVVHIAEKQQGMADNSALQEKIRLSARLSATIKLLQNIKTEEKVTDDLQTVSASRGMLFLMRLMSCSIIKVVCNNRFWHTKRNLPY